MIFKFCWDLIFNVIRKIVKNDIILIINVITVIFIKIIEFYWK